MSKGEIPAPRSMRRNRPEAARRHLPQGDGPIAGGSLRLGPRAGRRRDAMAGRRAGLGLSGTSIGPGWAMDQAASKAGLGCRSGRGGRAGHAGDCLFARVEDQPPAQNRRRQGPDQRRPRAISKAQPGKSTSSPARSTSLRGLHPRRSLQQRKSLGDTSSLQSRKMIHQERSLSPADVDTVKWRSRE